MKSNVLSFNRPSYLQATAPPEDRAVTAQLREAGKTLGIPVLDHVIVAGHSYSSVMEEG